MVVPRIPPRHDNLTRTVEWKFKKCQWNFSKDVKNSTDSSTEECEQGLVQLNKNQR